MSDTAEQVIAEAFAAIDARYDDEEDRTRARAAAKRVVRGTTELETYAERFHAAQAARDAAMVDLIGGILAAAQTTSANRLSSITGVNRKTIRTALGKTNVR